jgi:SAM-dependent methyltransferase/16S rRNA G966 N2-methylase RsmD
MLQNLFFQSINKWKREYALSNTKILELKWDLPKDTYNKIRNKKDLYNGEKTEYTSSKYVTKTDSGIGQQHSEIVLNKNKNKANSKVELITISQKENLSKSSNKLYKINRELQINKIIKEIINDVIGNNKTSKILRVNELGDDSDTTLTFSIDKFRKISKNLNTIIDKLAFIQKFAVDSVFNNLHLDTQLQKTLLSKRFLSEEHPELLELYTSATGKSEPVLSKDTDKNDDVIFKNFDVTKCIQYLVAIKISDDDLIPYDSLIKDDVDFEINEHIPYKLCMSNEVCQSVDEKDTEFKTHNLTESVEIIQYKVMSAVFKHWTILFKQCMNTNTNKSKNTNTRARTDSAITYSIEFRLNSLTMDTKDSWQPANELITFIKKYMIDLYQSYINNVIRHIMFKNGHIRDIYNYKLDDTRNPNMYMVEQNKPFDLSSDYNDKLINNSYTVTNKVDGTRRFLITDIYGNGYIVDNDLTYIEYLSININSTVPGTIIDGEMYTKDGHKKFLAFDIIYHNFQDVSMLNLLERHEHLETALFKIQSSWKQFTIRAKTFYYDGSLYNANKEYPYFIKFTTNTIFNQAISIWNRYVKEERDQENKKYNQRGYEQRGYEQHGQKTYEERVIILDGIIFTPVSASYGGNFNLIRKKIKTWNPNNNTTSEKYIVSRDYIDRFSESYLPAIKWKDYPSIDVQVKLSKDGKFVNFFTYRTAKNGESYSKSLRDPLQQIGLPTSSSITTLNGVPLCRKFPNSIDIVEFRYDSTASQIDKRWVPIAVRHDKTQSNSFPVIKNVFVRLYERLDKKMSALDELKLLHINKSKYDQVSDIVYPMRNLKVSSNNIKIDSEIVASEDQTFKRGNIIISLNSIDDLKCSITLDEFVESKGFTDDCFIEVKTVEDAAKLYSNSSSSTSTSTSNMITKMITKMIIITEDAPNFKKYANLEKRAIIHEGLTYIIPHVIQTTCEFELINNRIPSKLIIHKIYEYIDTPEQRYENFNNAEYNVNEKESENIEFTIELNSNVPLADRGMDLVFTALSKPIKGKTINFNYVIPLNEISSFSPDEQDIILAKDVTVYNRFYKTHMIRVYFKDGKLIPLKYIKDDAINSSQFDEINELLYNKKPTVVLTSIYSTDLINIQEKQGFHGYHTLSADGKTFEFTFTERMKSLIPYKLTFPKPSNISVSALQSQQPSRTVWATSASNIDIILPIEQSARVSDLSNMGSVLTVNVEMILNPVTNMHNLKIVAIKNYSATDFQPFNIIRKKLSELQEYVSVKSDSVKSDKGNPYANIISIHGNKTETEMGYDELYTGSKQTVERDKYNNMIKGKILETAAKIYKKATNTKLKEYANIKDIPTVVKNRAKSIYLLDLACGKGGDIHKWYIAGYTDILAIDISYENIYGFEKFRHRYKKKLNEIRSDNADANADTTNANNSPAFNITYVWGDTGKPLTQCGKTAYEQGKINLFMQKYQVEFGMPLQFDVITCNFAFHYMFYDTLGRTDVSRKQLSDFMSTIDTYLSPAGICALTTLDGNKLIDEAMRTNKSHMRFVRRSNVVNISEIDGKQLINMKDKDLISDSIFIYPINEKIVQGKILDYVFEKKIYNVSDVVKVMDAMGNHVADEFGDDFLYDIEGIPFKPPTSSREIFGNIVGIHNINWASELKEPLVTRELFEQPEIPDSLKTRMRLDFSHKDVSLPVDLDTRRLADLQMIYILSKETNYPNDDLLNGLGETPLQDTVVIYDPEMANLPSQELSRLAYNQPNTIDAATGLEIATNVYSVYTCLSSYRFNDNTGLYEFSSVKDMTGCIQDPNIEKDRKKLIVNEALIEIGEVFPTFTDKLATIAIDKSQLQISKLSTYNINHTHYVYFEKIKKFIEDFVTNPVINKKMNDLTILDITAGSGAMTVKYIDIFKMVFAMENHKLSYKSLVHNMREVYKFGKDKIRFVKKPTFEVLNDSEELKKMNIDILYMDPTWGGDDGLNESVKRLHQCILDKDVELVISEVFASGIIPIIVLKVAPNFDIKSFNRINGKYVKQYTRIMDTNNKSKHIFSLILCYNPSILPDSNFKVNIEQIISSEQKEHEFEQKLEYDFDSEDEDVKTASLKINTDLSFSEYTPEEIDRKSLPSPNYITVEGEEVLM